MSDTKLMKLREMIFDAFGDPEKNKVDFKLIHAILIILASRLGVLERTVRLHLKVPTLVTSSILSITEVKVYTHEQKKKQKQGLSSVPTGPLGGMSKYLGTEEESPEIEDIIKIGRTKDKGRTEGKRRVGDSGAVKGEEGVDRTDGGVIEGVRDRGRISSRITEKNKHVLPGIEEDGEMGSDRVGGGKKIGETGAGSKKDNMSLTGKPKYKKSHFDKSLYGDSSSSVSTGSVLEITSASTYSISEIPSHKSTFDLKYPKFEYKSSGSYDKTSKKSRSNKSETTLDGRVSTLAGRTGSKNTKSYKVDQEKDSSDSKIEKLIIVERKSESRLQRSSDSTTPLSIVSIDQFNKLASEVATLEDLFGRDEIIYESESYTDSTLSDPFGILQLSARLDKLEAAISRMNAALTELVRKKGFKPKNPYGDTTISVYRIELKRDQRYKPMNSKAISAMSIALSDPTTEFSVESCMSNTKYKPAGYWVTPDELNSALQELRKDITQMNSGLLGSCNKAQSALKMINFREDKEVAKNIKSNMRYLERRVAEFCDGVASLDSELSNTMTCYQDQLLQMKHDLESKLDTLVEAMANQTNVPAIEELNAGFTSFQTNCDKTKLMQNDEQKSQFQFKCNLKDLLDEIRRLGETKANRDEVANALDEKIGIEAFNGMVDEQQYSCSRGDIEKRIKTAYNKFNTIENHWQHVLNDLHNQLSEIADTVQIEAFSKDVNFHIDNLRNQIDYIESSVGPSPRELTRREPLSEENAKRKVKNGEHCLSCSTPGQKSYEDHMSLEEVKRKEQGKERVIGSKPKDYGDYKEQNLCYPGVPPAHIRDPRLYISQDCARYCTNEATAPCKTPSPLSSMLIDVQPLCREHGDGAESVPNDKKPCKRCFLGP